MEQNYTIAAFYCFFPLHYFSELRYPLLTLCRKNNLRGTLLLAPEGINGVIAGLQKGVEEVVAFISSQPEFSDLELKYATSQKIPFRRMKIRLKREIITMGVSGVDPLKGVGIHISPGEWNALIQGKNTILIDTRNDYEYAFGTFIGALNPKIKTFREFPGWIREHAVDLKKKKRIAMFCTGGIRCEKSTAYIRSLGFDQVYHLKGGILKYLKEIPHDKSLWKGECFVFDERISVTHGSIHCEV